MVSPTIPIRVMLMIIWVWLALCLAWTWVTSFLLIQPTRAGRWLTRCRHF